MAKCHYCQSSYDSEEELIKHLNTAHEREELGRIDRKRVDFYSEHNTVWSKFKGVTGGTSDSDLGIERRHLLALTGGTLGTAGLSIAAAGNDVTLADLQGSGTEADPYQITTFEELLLIDEGLDQHWILVNDIDASDTDPMTPLAAVDDPFTGSFNGQQHSISGLTIDGESTYLNSSGLFYAVESGTIEKLELTDIEVTGGGETGALIGRNNDGTVRRCSASGTVSDSGFDASDIGGLVGLNAGSIKRCFTTGSVNADGYQVGGLVGLNAGSIKRCFTTGSVNSDGTEVGGLVGDNQGKITNSYSTCEVRGGGVVGGLVGEIDITPETTVSKTYAVGTVTASEGPAGGLIGGLERALRIGRGDDDTFIEGSYWDTLTTGQANGIPGELNEFLERFEESTVDINGFDTDDGSGRAEEMIGSNAETNMDAFDFENVWTTVPDDYPALRWEDTRDTQSAAAVVLRGDNATVSNSTIQVNASSESS